MSTHVVIGGAGQIGHAIASVLEERHEVYRVDPPAGLYEIPSDGVHGTAGSTRPSGAGTPTSLKASTPSPCISGARTRTLLRPLSTASSGTPSCTTGPLTLRPGSYGSLPS